MAHSQGDPFPFQIPSPLSPISPPGIGRPLNAQVGHVWPPHIGTAPVGLNRPQLYPTATRQSGNAESEITEDDASIRQVAPQDPAQTQTNTARRLWRELDAWQVTMITIGVVLGTGVLVASGTALHQGGPLGLVLGFVFLGFTAYCMMTALCELLTFSPDKQGFIGAVTKYIHPSIGMGLGWTFILEFVFVPPSHINTAATVLAHVNQAIGHPNTSPFQSEVARGLSRFFFIILVIAANLLAIKAFGILEFWLSSFKVLALIALAIFGLVVSLGGARLEGGGFDRIGFRFWGSPFGPMGHGVGIVDPPGGTEPKDVFLGFWAALVRIYFAYVGLEMIGFVVGEVANPRTSIPKAIKQTYRLVFVLYISTAFIIGMICRGDDPALTDPELSLQGQASTYIIAASRLAGRALVPIINATVIVFALSGATANIYMGSRMLYGLSLDKKAPAFLRKVTTKGRPTLALASVVAWCFLSYIGYDEDNGNQAFAYFVDLTTSAGSISWICIFWAHIRFRKAFRLQNRDIRELPYVAPLQLYGTWFGLVVTIIFSIFKGYESYAKRSGRGFVAAYILFLWFALVSIFWKWYRSDSENRFVDLHTIDLQKGQYEIDLDERSYELQNNGIVAP